PTISYCFFYTHPATSEIYTLSLHDALPIYHELLQDVVLDGPGELGARHALLLAGHDEARQHGEHGAVHRHRHRHAVERYADRMRSEEHTSELQSRGHLVCRLLLEKKKKNKQ